MKAMYLALCLILVLAGTVMAYSGYDDDYYSDDYYYDDYGCCCGPVFALVAVGAFALRRH
ncbi:MAG: hypothetical protein GY852_07100 [bacterium]|nr:hypothetical protein [bacterium]